MIYSCLRSILVLLLLCSHNILTCFAQERLYNYLHFTDRDGLPSNIVHAIAQDSEGVIWVTTSMGLSYFDGVHFQSINFSDHLMRYSNDLGEVAIDKTGKLWISTFNQGLLCYDRSKPKNEALTAYHALVDNGNLVKGELYAVMVSQSGLVYFGGQETGLQVLDPETSKITHIQVLESPRSKEITVFSLKEDNEGNIWIGTRYDGFICYHPSRGYKQQYDLKNKGENGVCAFVITSFDVFTPYYDYDIVALNMRNGQIRTGLLGLGINDWFYDNFISALSYLPEEHTLLAGHVTDGIYLWDIAQGGKTHIGWDKILPDIPKKTRIRDLLVTEKGYWMATGNGLFFYPFDSNKFQNIYSFQKGNEIRQLFRVGNETWYLTQSSFGQFDKLLVLLKKAWKSDRPKIGTSHFAEQIYI